MALVFLTYGNSPHSLHFKRYSTISDSYLRAPIWLDIGTKQLMNRHDQAFRKTRKFKSNDNLKSYKTLRNKCNKKIMKAKSNHHKKALNYNINKPEKFWSQIKNVFPGKSQSVANISTDKHPSLNIPSHFYSTMVSKLKKSTYLQILPGIILQNLQQKLWKLLDFHIFQYYLYKKG